MGTSIREERLNDITNIFRLNSNKLKFNENSGFVVEVDSGSVDRRGSIEIVLEGIRLIFLRYKIEIVDGEERIIPISDIKFSNLKREHYLEEYNEKKIHSPSVSLKYDSVKNYSFSKERAEIIELTNFVMEKFWIDVDKFFEEEEIEEKMMLFCEYDMKKEFTDFLCEIANCYNAFINEDNAKLDRDDRAEEIRSNKEFQKQIELICAKFWIGLDCKIIDSKNVGLGGLPEKIKKYKEVMADIDKYIKMREYYGEISYKKNNKENSKRLKIIVDDFKSIKEQYDEIKKYEEKMLKGSANKEDLTSFLIQFEDEVKNCLTSLGNLSRQYSFSEYTNKMKLYMNDSLNEDIRSLQDYQEMTYSVEHTLRKFNEFLINYDGIDSQLSKTEIRRREEALAPYIEKLKERREIYREKLKLNTRITIDNIKDKKCMTISTFMALNQFLETVIQTLEMYNRIDWMIYTRNGTWLACSEEIKKDYEKIFVCLQALEELKSELQKEIDKDTGTQIQKLLECSDENLKASLYDKFMAERYKEKVGNLTTEIEKSEVFDKVLEKKLNGEGFFKNLLNPTPAFEDIESLYQAYLENTLMGVLEKIISTLENAGNSMGDVSSKEESKEFNNEMLNDMLVELEGKGLSREEALDFLGKLTEKVAEPKETGYYSDNDTEDTENSRFNAMNRR